MRFREVRPSEALSSIVDCFWEFSVGPDAEPQHIHSVPPDGCTSFACDLKYNIVSYVGPRLEPLRTPVYPGAVFAGVRFRPGATRAAIGLDGDALRDKVGSFASIVPSLSLAIGKALRGVKSLDEAIPLIEPLLTSNIQGEPDSVVQAGAAAIQHSAGSARIDEIASLCKVSERHFQRRFRQEVGLTPKQFARICRFRAAAIDVAMSGADDWGTVAAERGFADQPHLVREFARIFGMTPGEFKSTFAPAIEHIDVGR